MIQTHAPIAAPQRVGDATAKGSVTGVQILASVDGGAASDRPTYARKDQKVTLYALVRVGAAFYTDAPSPHLAGKAISAQPLAKAPSIDLAWQRIEPTTANMSNTQSGSFKFEAIEYTTSAIAAANQPSITADVRPTLTTDHGDGIGTMRYQLVATQGDRVLASPGIDAKRGRGSGGLGDAVTRVTIRRDDSFLGYLTEMYGQPYIWASAGLSDGSHESEHLEGSDCADLMVYGARRMGKKVAYTWTGGLPNVTKLVAGSGTRGDDGIYRDKAGKPLPFTAVGDLVLFPRHVGALAEDRGTIGVLDDQDIMLHTLFDSPKEQAIADSGYADTAVELRRWK
ncbi:MAG TPA: hypothetical protein VMZ53_05290 [Kofleriaceae bacterium]|nr:hypothetical protein [Kofleriaceae bacterium]